MLRTFTPPDWFVFKFVRFRLVRFKPDASDEIDPTDNRTIPVYRRLRVTQLDVLKFAHAQYIHVNMDTCMKSGTNLIKGRWGRLTDQIKWKWRKKLERFAVVFANRAPCEFCHFTHFSCFFCQIKRTNACSSPISGSERPDSQANSARQFTGARKAGHACRHVFERHW